MTDIAGAVLRLGHVLKRRGTIFLISDFLSPGGARRFETPLRLLARKQEVIALHVTDPRERELPRVGLVEVLDAESGERRLLDTSSRRAREDYSRAARAREAELAALFSRAGIDRVELSTARPFIQDLVRYFQLRERRRSA